MTVYVKGHQRHYDLQCMALLFMPATPVRIIPAEGFRRDAGDDIAVYSSFTRRGKVSICRTSIRGGGKRIVSVSRCRGAGNDAEQMAVKRSFFLAGVRFFGIRPPWGVLTGIRPAKFAHELAARHGAEKARTLLEREYRLLPEKAELALSVARLRDTLPLHTGPRDVSLYVSIPFCPSRCSYCSFVSHDITKSRRLVPQYLELLHREAEAAGELARRLRLTVRSVYVGGGTPTILEPEDISALIKRLRAAFDLSSLSEFTFEAGRPDTITPEKLSAMREGGVGRISINPQSMNQAVLDAIGRRHSPEDVIRAFETARRAGIPVINADLIAGLPADTLQGFAATLDAVLALEPENITVHTLSIKRAAEIKTMPVAKTARRFAMGEELFSELLHSQNTLMDRGYRPYYMYRQKNTAGNLENVGYALSGTECLYNLYMMEELHTVLGLGAGAVTKLVDPAGNIERIFLPKYPYEYIDRHDGIILRMKRMTDFYEQYYDELGV